MGERWVKATLMDGQFSSGVRWINMAGNGIVMRQLEGVSGGTAITLNGETLRYNEPPEHFLPKY